MIMCPDAPARPLRRSNPQPRPILSGRVLFPDEERDVYQEHEQAEEREGSPDTFLQFDIHLDDDEDDQDEN
jgi:hypothetical protein